MASAVGLSVRSAPTRGSNLKFLRVLRTLRLIKLLKLVSGSRLWQRWQMEHSINYGMLNIVGAVIKVVLFAHWVACLWGLQASVYHDLGSTWVAVDYGCTSAHEDFEDCFGDAGYARPYLRALYFAVTTITSVGYGDVTANANNEMELMTWETRGLELTRQQRHHSPSNHSAITLQSLCNHSNSLTRQQGRGSIRLPGGRQITADAPSPLCARLAYRRLPDVGALLCGQVHVHHPQLVFPVGGDSRNSHRRAHVFRCGSGRFPHEDRFPQHFHAQEVSWRPTRPPRYRGLAR